MILFLRIIVLTAISVMAIYQIVTLLPVFWAVFVFLWVIAVILKELSRK